MNERQLCGNCQLKLERLYMYDIVMQKHQFLCLPVCLMLFFFNRLRRYICRRTIRQLPRTFCVSSSGGLLEAAAFQGETSEAGAGQEQVTLIKCFIAAAGAVHALSSPLGPNQCNQNNTAYVLELFLAHICALPRSSRPRPPQSCCGAVLACRLPLPPPSGRPDCGTR